MAITALAAAAMAATTLGTGMSVTGSLMQGRAAGKAGKTNAYGYMIQADRIAKMFGSQEAQLEKSQEAARGTLSAALAEHGGGKSEEAIMNSYEVEAAIEREMLKRGAISQVSAARQNAISSYYGGRQAKRASYWQAGTSVLTGAGKLMGQASGTGMADSLKSIWNRQGIPGSQLTGYGSGMTADMIKELM